MAIKVHIEMPLVKLAQAVSHVTMTIKKTKSFHQKRTRFFEKLVAVLPAFFLIIKQKLNLCKPEVL
jgi:hypothetical protein